MGRIIKALIFGWIGKKIYERTLGRSSSQERVADDTAEGTRRPKRTTAAKPAPRKPTRRAA